MFNRALTIANHFSDKVKVVKSKENWSRFFIFFYIDKKIYCVSNVKDSGRTEQFFTQKLVDGLYHDNIRNYMVEEVVDGYLSGPNYLFDVKLDNVFLTASTFFPSGYVYTTKEHIVMEDDDIYFITQN